MRPFWGFETAATIVSQGQLVQEQHFLHVVDFSSEGFQDAEHHSQQQRGNGVPSNQSSCAVQNENGIILKVSHSIDPINIVYASTASTVEKSKGMPAINIVIF